MTERTVSGASLAPDNAVAQAAERLILAARTGVPTAPVRDVLGSTDVALAYQVQNALTAARKAAGARVVGRKVGLTSTAVQRQLGVDQPDFGVLFDDMLVPSGAEVDSGRLIAPKAEAEIAFVLSADMDGFAVGLSPDAPISAADRAAAAAEVDYAVAALEIVDSRVAGWDITITDTVADNDSSANGAACLGDPLNALIWLARTAASLGPPLRAGDVILSGALGAMVTAEPGTEITAELSTLGRVSVTFSQ